jgi:hypothetical protein
MVAASIAAGDAAETVLVQTRSSIMPSRYRRYPWHAPYWPESGEGMELAPHLTQADAIQVTVYVKGDGFDPNANITIVILVEMCMLHHRSCSS